MNGASIVEDSHLTTRDDAARRGIVGVKQHSDGAGLVAMPVQRRERRVEEEPRRRRDQHEREALGQFTIRRPRAGGVANQGVMPVLLGGLRPQLDLARRRGEAALGERRRPNIEIGGPDESVLAQVLTRDPTLATGRRVEKLLDQLELAAQDALVGDAEATPQAAQDLGIRAGSRRTEPLPAGSSPDSCARRRRRCPAARSVRRPEARRRRSRSCRSVAARSPRRTGPRARTPATTRF